MRYESKIDRALKAVEGAKVTKVWDGNGEVAISFDNGKTLYSASEGDCCSYSWVAHVSGVAAVIGQSIDRAEERPEYATHADESDETSKSADVLALYGVTLITERGDMLDIDYRNDSNGYYGGWLNWAVGGAPSSGYRETEEDF